ncbi:MAG: hypothetical protein ACPGJS_20070 [Flammeovirgaceae bacterium]
MDETKTLIEAAKNVSPYGYEVYGFVIILLLVMIIAIAWEYKRTKKTHEDTLKKAIEVIALFVHETSAERVKERNEMFLLQIKNTIISAMREAKQDAT